MSWLYYKEPDLLAAIVSDEFFAKYISHPGFVVTEKGDDIWIYLRVAVFQPIGSHQLLLF